MSQRWITLNYDGGTGPYDRLYIRGSSYTGFFTETSLISAGTVTVPSVKPTRRGCIFLYWYKQKSGHNYQISDSNGKFDPGALGSIYEDNTISEIVAGWQEYPVRSATLNANGGTVSPSQVSVRFEHQIGSIPTPSRPGYTFAGWYTEPSGGSLVTSTTYWWQESNGTIYAHWTDNPTYTLTFWPNEGDVSPSSKSCKQGLQIGDLPTPTRDGYVFDGWFTEGEGGSQVTSETIYTWRFNAGIFAHWTKKPILTFDPNGGTVSPTTRECWYGEAIGNLPAPTKTGYFFAGWYDDAEEGNLVTANTPFEWNGDVTIFAHWSADEVYRIVFDPSGGISDEYERTIRPGETIGELPSATRERHSFDGWWTEQTGGTQVTDETVFEFDSDMYLFAHWTRTEYTIFFDANGGAASFESKDVTLNTSVGELPTCEKFANTFLGWFTQPTGGTLVDENDVYTSQDDTTLYAHWETDPQYVRTISLNAEGGSVSPTTISCTYGLRIGDLPRPDRSAMIFLGWFTSASGGTKYTADSVCNWPDSITLHAHWAQDVFGNLTDWFGLETANGPLMLVKSTDGAERSVAETSHTGSLAIQDANSSVGAFWRGGILRNPVCTYRIRRSGNVSIQLGKAWPKSGTSVSGYMLVKAAYSTAADGEPVLVVRGAANEGANAINRWTVALAVNPDHISQDPMGAVSGGGELIECKTIITCDPVVPMENGMPCASDIVHGKIIVEATTNAYLGENAPTSGGEFIETNGVPAGETDVDFTSYSFRSERSL